MADTPVRDGMCDTCPFQEGGSPDRITRPIAEIKDHAAMRMPFYCHTSTRADRTLSGDERVCAGAVAWAETEEARALAPAAWERFFRRRRA